MKTENELKPDLEYHSGDTLLCIKDWVMQSGDIKFNKGKVYVATSSESIRNNSGVGHGMKPTEYNHYRLDEYFQHISISDIFNSHESLKAELSSKEALIGELKKQNNAFRREINMMADSMRELTSENASINSIKPELITLLDYFDKGLRDVEEGSGGEKQPMHSSIIAILKSLRTPSEYCRCLRMDGLGPSHGDSESGYKCSICFKPLDQ